MNEQQEATAILSEVMDPELGLDIVALGLVYGLEVTPGEVYVAMATTSPMCPMGEVIRNSAEDALRRRWRTRAISVEVVLEPRWQVGMMDERARHAVGLA